MKYEIEPKKIAVLPLICIIEKNRIYYFLYYCPEQTIAMDDCMIDTSGCDKRKKTNQLFVGEEGGGYLCCIISINSQELQLAADLDLNETKLVRI